MHDDLERTAESPAVSSGRPPIARLETIDVSRAIAIAEGLASTRILEGASALDEALEAASNGERIAVVAPCSDLSTQRPALRRIAQARLGLVVHALASHGNEDLGAFVDIGWGVLCASGPEDSLDLSLVARRAAEDSGVPFIVVHALARVDGAAGRAVAAVGIPHEKAVHTFASGKSRLKQRTDPAHPSMAPDTDRAFADRVPFALGSALREYGSVSGRRHDVFDKIPMGEAPLVLVGMGPVGDALFSATNELRARGYEVSAIHVSALRPFPGARLVKALARALAVTVLEPTDEPLSHGGLLARELKSAFTDALTWVPGFPGIGRIPKLFVGVTGPSFDVADLAAVCDNMLADERGKRSFSFADVEHALPRPPATEQPASGPVAFRWVLDDLATADAAIAATSSALANTLGLRLHAVITPAKSGEGATVDAFAARDQARGGMARRAPRLVLATARGVASSDAVTSLANGGVLAVVGGGDTAGVVPDGARAMVRERRARILPLPGGEGESAAGLAAACAGSAVAIASRTTRATVDAAELSRVIGEHGERGRRAYEATLDAVSAQDQAGNGTKPVGVA